MPSGGYRKPAHPAAVSGPGALSQRTDGQPIRDITGGDYGDASEFRSLQQSAPVAQAPGLPSGPAVQGSPAPQAVSMGDPGDPNIPVTAGAAAGPGPGPAALGLPQSPADAKRADASNLRPYLAAMVSAAQSPSASQDFKNYVREVIASL